VNAAPALVTLLLLVACSKEVAPQSAAKEAPPAKTEPAPDPAVAEPDKPAIPELTEEDKRLIAADPKTLSPDERRKRAYALRRKIMQNPDSESAKMLEELRRAAEAGEIQPPGTLHLEQRTAPTKSADAPTTDESKSKAP
jgi:hypothetical protein